MNYLSKLPGSEEKVVGTLTDNWSVRFVIDHQEGQSPSPVVHDILQVNSVRIELA